MGLISDNDIDNIAKLIYKYNPDLDKITLNRWLANVERGFNEIRELDKKDPIKMHLRINECFRELPRILSKGIESNLDQYYLYLGNLVATIRFRAEAILWQESKNAAASKLVKAFEAKQPEMFEYLKYILKSWQGSCLNLLVKLGDMKGKILLGDPIDERKTYDGKSAYFVFVNRIKLSKISL